MNASARGLFINFEGIDGAGKSSHIEFVTGQLSQRGLTVVNTREPGGTELGEKIRDLLLHEKMNLETEALLMFASRRELLDRVIAPALARGDCVLSDRFSDSSFAFQSGGRGLSYDKLSALENWVHPGLQPDLTLLFDVPTEVAHARMSNSRNLDKFEQEKADFHKRVRNTYLERAEQFPERFRVIDSTRSILEIRKELVAVVDTFLATRNENTPVLKQRGLRP